MNFAGILVGGGGLAHETSICESHSGSIWTSPSWPHNFYTGSFSSRHETLQPGGLPVWLQSPGNPQEQKAWTHLQSIWSDRWAKSKQRCNQTPPNSICVKIEGKHHLAFQELGSQADKQTNVWYLNCCFRYKTPIQPTQLMIGSNWSVQIFQLPNRQKRMFPKIKRIYLYHVYWYLSICKLYLSTHIHTYFLSAYIILLKNAQHISTQIIKKYARK